jgi:hypothetical protein
MNASAAADVPRWHLSERNVAVVFLLPAFFLRAFIGGEGGSYADYVGVSLAPLGYFCHFGLVIYALAVGRLRLDSWQPLAFIVLAFLSAIQIGHLEAAGVIRADEAILPLLRGLLWLTFIWCGHQLITGSQPLIDAYEWLCKITAVIVLSCLLAYLITGVPFGVHIANGMPRPHGFLSEPSGLTYVVPGLVALSTYRRNYPWLLVGLLTAALSLSVIAVAVTLIVLPFSYWLRAGWIRACSAVTIMLGGLAIVLPLVLMTATGKEFIVDLSAAAEHQLDAINTDTENVFVTGLGVRVLGAVASLSDSLVDYSPSDANSSGSLARLIGVLLVHEALAKADAQYLGFGLNVYGYVATRQDSESALDFGLLSYLTSSFGMIVGPALFTLLILSVARYLHRHPLFALFLFVFVVATMYNSASGLHAYSVPMLGILRLLSRYRWTSDHPAVDLASAQATAR